MKYFLDTTIILIYLRNNNTRYIIDKQFATFSYPNMGKNDLWIAASAVASKAKLLTTNKNFIYLKKYISNH